MIHEVQGSQLVRQVSAFRLRSSNKASFRDSRYAREISNREVGPKVGDLCLNAMSSWDRSTSLFPRDEMSCHSCVLGMPGEAAIPCGENIRTCKEAATHVKTRKIENRLEPQS
jgi:hypothetical protein